MNSTVANPSWTTRIRASLARFAAAAKRGAISPDARPGQLSANELSSDNSGFWSDFSRQTAKAAPEEPTSSKPLNILVPTDFSEKSDRVLDCALKMAACHPTRITLLHAIHLNLIPHGPANVAEQKIALCREAIAKSGPFIAAARNLGITAACMFDEGPPPAVIARAVRRCRPDLVILSKTKTAWPFRWFGRGTIQAAVRESDCPVLVVPA